MSWLSKGTEAALLGFVFCYSVALFVVGFAVGVILF